MLSDKRIGFLKGCDVVIRGAVRSWLHLPEDTPVCFFHAHQGDGGLGIMLLKDVVPLLQRKRMNKLDTVMDDAVRVMANSERFQRTAGKLSGPTSSRAMR